MTMQFHAENPAILQGIVVGDHVAFELKSASETGILTMVQKQ
jgi:Cu/Ag efflux protein CusF